jgi:hypothetical protein
MAAPLSLQPISFIKITRAGLTDFAVGILYRDGMVLAMDAGETDFALVPARDLIARGSTLTKIPKGFGTGVNGLNAATVVSPEVPYQVPVIRFDNYVYMRASAGLGGDATVARRASIGIILSDGAVLASRLAPGFGWG